MISALIHVRYPSEHDAHDRLADTLSALVEGVAAGLVGDAVIIADVNDNGLVTIAEGSGAILVSRGPALTPWHAGAAAARHGWVLCLEAGDVPREGWIRTLDRFVGTARAETELGRLRRPRTRWHGCIREWIGRHVDRIAGADRPSAGDLVQRARLLSNAPFLPRLRTKMISARLDSH